jgi:hypothetical protein
MIGFIGTSITITVIYNILQSMTVLVLIYELTTSLASVVRWLALHSWTLNSSWLDYDCLMNEFVRIGRIQSTETNYWIEYCRSSYTAMLRKWNEQRDKKCNK